MLVFTIHSGIYDSCWYLWSAVCVKTQDDAGVPVSSIYYIVHGVQGTCVEYILYSSRCTGYLCRVYII